MVEEKKCHIARCIDGLEGGVEGGVKVAWRAEVGWVVGVGCMGSMESYVIGRMTHALTSLCFFLPPVTSSSSPQQGSVVVHGPLL